MNAKGFLQWFHTARHLKVKQVIYRVIYRFYKCSGNVSINTPMIRRGTQLWVAPSIVPSRMDRAGQFNFLNKIGFLTRPSDWNNPHYSKLWLYNLHYFDELTTCHASARPEELNHLISRWIAENPVMQGNGWEPYPLSLRIVNFVKWFVQHPKSVSGLWLQSLALQAEMLLKQREYHILGNHLFANAKALVFVGVFLDGARANLWFKKGLRILDQQIKEQFLPDGGHFELSPMYHAILLWDMLDLLNLSYCSDRIELRQRRDVWEQIIKKGFDWLCLMSHPDKKISFFNDAAFGIAPEITDIMLYANQLNVSLLEHTNKKSPFEWLSDSGYCVVNLDSACKAIIDMAHIGPDYLPGHAHADTLSFELSLYGQRFLVNSGTSQYGDDEQRFYERSTKAHNTVTIDEENSSEIWAGFRVARRAYPQNRMIGVDKKTIVVAAEHDGYKRLTGKNIHRREWRFDQKKLILKDVIKGKYNRATLRLYFHPGVQVKIINPFTIQCQLRNQEKILLKFQGDCVVALEHTFWYPQFGVKKENCCLAVQFKGNELITEIEW